ncbi:hypothetical protein QQF64_036379 [Cirrhinus molitorella]|uniref:Fucolectin tachylectin-4 pentraxin-1 domain-containing protein n=1 Tax=Cirrhinus molitorella TaxID=172907 RepID=A0ABR3NJ84_9TELE
MCVQAQLFSPVAEGQLSSLQSGGQITWSASTGSGKNQAFDWGLQNVPFWMSQNIHRMYCIYLHSLTHSGHIDLRRDRMGVLVMLLLSLLPGLCDAVLTNNLALGASAVQSSTYNLFGMAYEAVDGRRSMRMLCTHTAIQNNPWWRVDLTKVYQITRVVITNGGEQISGAEIHIGNLKTNHGNNNQLAVTLQSIPTGGTVSFDFKPIEGRYVNICLPRLHRALSLCEVEVFAEYDPTCVPGNLALGAKAVQSSVVWHFDARNAVDGNRDTEAKRGSCSLTLAGRPSWWRVDLRKVYKIRKVTITFLRHRYHVGTDDLQGSQIRIGNSLANKGNSNPLATVIGYIPIAGTRTFEFAPMYGRYVNIVGKDPILYVWHIRANCPTRPPQPPASWPRSTGDR